MAFHKVPRHLGPFSQERQRPSFPRLLNRLLVYISQSGTPIALDEPLLTHVCLNFDHEHFPSLCHAEASPQRLGNRPTLPTFGILLQKTRAENIPSP